MEYKNIETRLINKTARGCQGSHKLGQLEDSIFFLCKYVFLSEKYEAKDRFRFSSIIIVGCYYPKKLKIERRKKAKLREKRCAYFHDSCSRAMLILLRLFARNFTFGAEANISARAEVRHVIAAEISARAEICHVIGP